MAKADPVSLTEALRYEVASLGLLHPHGARVINALHLGRPAGPRVRLVLPTRSGHVRARHDDPYADDPALRREVAGRMLEAAVAGGFARHAWLVRAGDADPHQSEALWASAMRAAAAETGLEITGFHVVTRTGWREVWTGTERRWSRLRVRGRRAAAEVDGIARAVRATAQSQVCTGSLVCIRSL